MRAKLKPNKWDRGTWACKPKSWTW